MTDITEHTVKYTVNGEKQIHYLSAGPRDGPLLIFIHGWPGIAISWKPQIETFATLGFRVIAPDMPGYGRSTVTKVSEDYCHEIIIEGLLALLKNAGRDEAVWLAHDWGAGVVSTLMGTHPEVFRASCLMTVPYRTIEFGLEALVATVNRDIYPEDQYPWGQWEYQAFYEQSFDKATAFFDADPEAFLRAITTKPKELNYGKPAPTSTVVRDGGWFGGLEKPLPNWRQIPPETSIFPKDYLEELIAAMKQTGFFAADSYYSNHKRNRAFNLEHSVNGGVFTKPLLFIEAKWDSICDTALSRLAEPMRKYATHLTEVSIDAGHMVAIQEPQETNAAIARWLAKEVEDYWPYYWKNGHVKNY